MDRRRAGSGRPRRLLLPGVEIRRRGLGFDPAGKAEAAQDDLGLGGGQSVAGDGLDDVLAAIAGLLHAEGQALPVIDEIDHHRLGEDLERPAELLHRHRGIGVLARHVEDERGFVVPLLAARQVGPGIAHHRAAAADMVEIVPPGAGHRGEQAVAIIERIAPGRHRAVHMVAAAQRRDQIVAHQIIGVELHEIAAAHLGETAAEHMALGRLVAAELAAMFQDKQGGVFRWVGEAYGKKLGFLAIWVQWIESTIWYPTVLTFGAVSIAFIGMNDVHDMSLANNKYYSLVVVLIIYWLATFISMKGMSWVGKVAKVGGLVGTIIPAALLIILGIIYLATGGHSNLDFHSSFFPDLTNFDNVVLAASIFLFYAGMEMGGIHVKDVNNPSKNYPKAVFIGAAITVIIFVLGTFSLGIIIPAKDISLTQSLLVGFDNYFHYIRASWLSPIIAIALAFGVLAGVLTWVAGPSKGIFAVGKAGYMPPFFQKTNKLGVQKNILYVQGGAVTVLSLLFVVMPSVQSFYQILSQLTVVLYLIMYMLMFSGAIVLRYKMKKLNRPFRIGKNGNGLMWLIGGLGFCGSLLAFVLSFIPPSQISTGSNTVWFSVLIIGALIVVIAPFIIYASKKPSWVDPNSSFEPFHWEEQPAVQTAGKSATNMATGSATTSNNGTSNSATSGNTAKDTTNIPKG